MNGARWRLIVIALLMLLSVVVDSVYYLVSAATDALFMATAVFLAWPVVKKLW
jgi:membrane protein YdbS with pleckstrin-like domain